MNLRFCYNENGKDSQNRKCLKREGDGLSM